MIRAIRTTGVPQRSFMGLVLYSLCVKVLSVQDFPRSLQAYHLTRRFHVVVPFCPAH